MHDSADVDLERAVEGGIRQNGRTAAALVAVQQARAWTCTRQPLAVRACEMACLEARSMRDALAAVQVALSCFHVQADGGQGQSPESTGEAETACESAGAAVTEGVFARSDEAVVHLNLSRAQEYGESLTDFMGQITPALEHPTDTKARGLRSIAKDLAGSVLFSSRRWERGARELLGALWSHSTPGQVTTFHDPSIAVDAAHPGDRAERDQLPTGPIEALECGAFYRFADWPNEGVPRVAAGVYTVWRGEELIYVGTSGPGQTTEDLARAKVAGETAGLRPRLDSHATGHRNGDQFCVDVGDRFVLPTLDARTVRDIGVGSASFDGIVRLYIHQHFGYRFVVTRDGPQAKVIQTLASRGALPAGRPFLNAER